MQLAQWALTCYCMSLFGIVHHGTDGMYVNLKVGPWALCQCQVAFLMIGVKVR